MIRPIRFVPFLLIALLALPAFAEEPPTTAAPPAYETELAKLAAPSAAGAFTFEGEFEAGGGQLTGSAILEAKVTKVGDATGWATRVHLAATNGAVSIEETGLYDAHLRPISGSTKQTTPGGKTHFSWTADEGGVRLTDHMGGAQEGMDPPTRRLAHEGAFQGDLAVFVLFSRLIGQREGSFKTDLLDADESKFVSASWTSGKVGTWNDKPAKLVQAKRSDGKTLEAGFDAKTGDMLGLRLGQGGQVRIELRRLAPKGFFDVPAKTPQQAAAQATLSFAIADFELLERVTHWPSVHAAHLKQHPDEPMEIDAYKELLMGRFRATLKPQGERSMVAPVLESMSPSFKTSESEFGTVVEFGPMFRDVKITVGEVDGVWYLTKFPDAPKPK